MIIKTGIGIAGDFFIILFVMIIIACFIMNKTVKEVMNGGNYFILTGVWCVFCMLLTCASQSGEWQGKLLYSNKQLAVTDRATGRDVVVLPLIIDNRFDTGQSLAPERFTKALIHDQGAVRVLFRKDFEEKLILKYGREHLDSFYMALIKNDILALNALDTVWNGIPGRYLLTIRVTTGVRINSFDDIVKRKADLEAELWDSKKIEIIWRGQSSGYEMDPEVSDAAFIMKGIQTLFMLLPEFIPVREEDNW